MVWGVVTWSLRPPPALSQLWRFALCDTWHLGERRVTKSSPVPACPFLSPCRACPIPGTIAMSHSMLPPYSVPHSILLPTSRTPQHPPPHLPYPTASSLEEAGGFPTMHDGDTPSSWAPPTSPIPSSRSHPPPPLRSNQERFSPSSHGLSPHVKAAHPASPIPRPGSGGCQGSMGRGAAPGGGRPYPARNPLSH